MGKGAKTVAAPDPVATSAAQTASNKDTAYYNALLNNVNQTTPYGSLTYQNNGNATNPNFSSTVKLSPEQQKLYDLQTQGQTQLGQLGNDQISRIQQSVSTPYSFSGLPNQISDQDYNDYQTKAEDALNSRLDPEFAKDEEALRTRLINQGITQGSQAYNNEMNTFNQGKNDAREQSVLNGQQYATSMLNNSLASRNQAINEYNTQRNAPLNEYNAFTSGTQIQNPTFQNPSNNGAANTDVLGAYQQQYQAQQANANAANASSNSLTGGLFGLGGSLLGGYAASPTGSKAISGLFSDERLKQDIKPIGVEKGHNIYEFSYKSDPSRKYRGVMAQEVQKTNPEAISEREGYLAVDYQMLGLEMSEVE